jgi:hypothetical protein
VLYVVPIEDVVADFRRSPAKKAGSKQRDAETEEE